MGCIKHISLALAVFFLFIAFSSATPVTKVFTADYAPQPIVKTGQTDEWFYTSISVGDNTRYVGINKLSRGIMGFGDNNEFYGHLWFIPAFFYGSDWYVCPIVDIETVNEIKDLGNGWWFNLSDSALICYQYPNVAVSVNANMDFQISFITYGTNTKINVNATVNGVAPADTGFAFLFIPENQQEYRYVRLNGDIYDLAGVDGLLPTDKVFEFLNADQDPIGNTFDWSDMLDTGNRYSELITLGNKKGLFVGTYGYGASNRIEIDPSYNFSISASSPSWHLINGSILFNQSINDYEAKVNITAGLSDNSSATRYKTTIGTIEPLNFYYSFNDYSLTQLHDSSGHGNDLTKQPYAYISKALDIYSLQTTINSGGGAKALSEPEFDIGSGDFTMGVIINVSNATSFYKYVVRRYDFPNGFYYIYLTNTWTVRAYFRTDLGIAKSLISTTTMNDSQPHSIVIRRNTSNDTTELLIDGVAEASVNGLNGSISSFGDLEVGSIYSSYGWNGYIDELFLIERALSDAEINEYTAKRHLYLETKGQAIQPYFNRQVNTSNAYSLKITKYGSGTMPVRVYSMENMNDTNLSSYIDETISEGENFVNIDSIIYDGYNFPFRLSDLHNDYNISEISLYEVGNDTTPPTIYNCFVNDSFVDCNESVTWACHITDDSAVSEAWGVVHVVGTPYNITEEAFRSATDDTLWEVKLSAAEIRILFESFNWTFDSYLNITLAYINATDIAGNTAENSSITPPVWNIYGCILCEPNWSVQYGLCLTNDTKLKYYNDTKNCNNSFGLPADNGTYVACDYCSPDVSKQYTSECYHNGSYYVINYTWEDDEYWSCCVITNLPSDCPTDYSPYNESGVDYCTFIQNDFDVDYDSEIYFGLTPDKVYWKFNLNDTNNSYKCVSYVKTTSGNLLQVNPQHTSKTISIVQLSSGEYEDRKYFETNNGIGNVYFTKENLVIDGRLYLLGVECAGNGQTLKSERLVKVFYEPVNAPITRWFWLKENIVPMVFFMLLSIFAIFFFAWAVKRAKYG